MAPSIAPARVAAFDVIRRVFEDEAYADRALRKATAGLDDRDRALARQLAYGTVQRARTLDHAIEIAGRRPVGRLDAAVRAALRLGAYQLVFLDGVPRYAAVNESVELVRRAGLERAVPFANAVLRRLADEGRSGRRGPAGLDVGRGSRRALVPGLGGRDVVARPRRGRRAGADARPERRPGDRRPARPWRDRRRARSGRPRSLACRARRRDRVRRGPRVAAERRLPARRARGRRRSRASGCSTSAPPREARRRCWPARSSPSR